MKIIVVKITRWFSVSPTMADSETVFVVKNGIDHYLFYHSDRKVVVRVASFIQNGYFILDKMGYTFNRTNALGAYKVLRIEETTLQNAKERIQKRTSVVFNKVQYPHLIVEKDHIEEFFDLLQHFLPDELNEYSPRILVDQINSLLDT